MNTMSRVPGCSVLVEIGIRHATRQNLGDASKWVGASGARSDHCNRMPFKCIPSRLPNPQLHFLPNSEIL